MRGSGVPRRRRNGIALGMLRLGCGAGCGRRSPAFIAARRVRRVARARSVFGRVQEALAFVAVPAEGDACCESLDVLDASTTYRLRCSQRK